MYQQIIGTSEDSRPGGLEASSRLQAIIDVPYSIRPYLTTLHLVPLPIKRTKRIVVDSRICGFEALWAGAGGGLEVTYHYALLTLLYFYFTLLYFTLLTYLHI